MYIGNVWGGVAGCAVIIGYYAWLAWLVRRRHRVAAPPASDVSLSPAAVRFVEQGRFDSRALLATILSLVAKGALSLRPRPDGTAYIEPALAPPDETGLDADDQLVRTMLFRTGNRSVDLADARDRALIDSAQALKTSLEQRYLSRPDFSRRLWLTLLAGGGVLAAAAVILTATFYTGGPYGSDRALLVVVLYGFGLGTLLGCIAGIRRLRHAGIILTISVLIVNAILLPTVFVFIGGYLLAHFRVFGPVGIAQLTLPLLGTLLLVRAARPKLPMPENILSEIRALRARLNTFDSDATPNRSVVSVDASTPIDPFLPYAVAMGYSEGYVGQPVERLAALPVEPDTINLFGMGNGKVGDAGLIGTAATR